MNESLLNGKIRKEVRALVETIIFVLMRAFWCVLGAIFISSGFDNYREKRYGCLGLDAMIIFMICVYIIQSKLMIM